MSGKWDFAVTKLFFPGRPIFVVSNRYVFYSKIRKSARDAQTPIPKAATLLSGASRDLVPALMLGFHHIYS